MDHDIGADILDLVPVGDLARGYSRYGESWRCLACGESVGDGEVRAAGDRWLDAPHWLEWHVVDRHGSVLAWLLSLGPQRLGLTAHQLRLVGELATGDPDDLVRQRLEGISAGTLRTHRFLLREKGRQARLVVALLESLEPHLARKGRLVPVHAGARAVDERYAITEEEQQEAVTRYFDGDRLLAFPKTQKRKLAVLRQLARRFQPGRQYTETEVNSLLRSAWQDVADLRRYLIEYGFMGRESDCSAYWRQPE